uniref:Integral membrane protein TerC n=1 Tax=Solibacter usitatus (strain Ellin6076) TaxID=234267 RepID=Q02CJ7_SOLUE
MNTPLFPFAEYWWFYAAFSGFVLLVLAMDLGIFHRKLHAVGFREALTWTALWAALSLLFCLGLYWYVGSRHGPEVSKQAAIEFLTGYVVEWSLSLDNMFVFALIFGFFAVPERYQHRILFYGILGAMVFRAIFIALGSALLQNAWMVVVFGLFLCATGVKMLVTRERPVDLNRSPIVRLLQRYIPIASTGDGHRFLQRVDGRLLATPLLVTLVFIEISDIIFAIDSVPAIFAITREPLIVFTSNVFAILGLRSMYFLLAGAVHRFHLLRYGLALVLIFVGLKMAWLNQISNGHFPMGPSLAIIGGILAAAIGLSLMFPKRIAGTAEAR